MASNLAAGLLMLAAPEVWADGRGQPPVPTTVWAEPAAPAVGSGGWMATPAPRPEATAATVPSPVVAPPVGPAPVAAGTVPMMGPTTACPSSVPAGTSALSGPTWRPTGLFDELTVFAGIDGSKQPQDFGVNATLGGQSHVLLGVPLVDAWGLGLQAGTGMVWSGNAVQVYDLIGESTSRTQSFTSVGVFQRTDSGFGWGFTYDYLHEQFFDTFDLGQWRVRGQYDLTDRDQVGLTAAISDRADTGVFGANTPVTLRPITQGSLFWRHLWQTGAQTTAWGGVAEGHGENNAVTGPAPAKDEVFVFGADVLVPLNDYLALYGETNLMMPADTGTVDAYLGVQFYPGGRAKLARQTRYSPLLPMAAPTQFSVDLVQ